MPRGPSGRACEACHAQKKKCDLKRPSCTRCDKLRITCVGGGVQRFKFVVAGKKGIPFRPQQSSSALSVNRNGNALRILPRTPLNETELLTQSFTTRLELKEDLGRSISWAWGPILLAVPRRLGRNKALDEAARTILIDHRDVLVGENRGDALAPGVVGLMKSVRLLRETLDDPDQRSTAETFAAIYLILISQCRFGGIITPFSSLHGTGALQLLRLRNWDTGTGSFEQMVYLEMKATVLYQAFVNPNIHLTASEYQNLQDSLDGTATEYKLFQVVIKICQLLSSARELISNDEPTDKEATQAYLLQQSLLNIAETLRKRYHNFKPLSHNLPLSKRLHAHYQRSYSRALTFHGMLITARRTLSPEDTPNLDADAEQLCHRALQLSKEGYIYLPLGWRYAWTMLMPIWGATNDLEMRREVEEELVRGIWHSERPSRYARTLVSDQLKWMRVRLSLGEAGVGHWDELEGLRGSVNRGR